MSKGVERGKSVASLKDGIMSVHLAMWSPGHLLLSWKPGLREGQGVEGWAAASHRGSYLTGICLVSKSEAGKGFK